MKQTTKTRRHVLSLSGGKDSAALAVYLKDRIPDLEYVFLDTGHELPETYEFLNRMRAILGIEIVALKPKRHFDFWLGIYNGCLPSPKNRWCTRQLKIRPYEKYVGSSYINSYVALRADEDRMGYMSHRDNIIPYYPFIEDGLVKTDIIQILDDSGLGLPNYYKWRSRSGCYFCFYQRVDEWIGLYHNHPELFEMACKYETNHIDGRTYTWVQGHSLKTLASNSNRGKSRNNSNNKTKQMRSQNKYLINSLKNLNFDISNNEILLPTSISDEKEKPCLICTL